MKIKSGLIISKFLEENLVSDKFQIFIFTKLNNCIYYLMEENLQKSLFNRKFDINRSIKKDGLFSFSFFLDN